MKAEHTRIKRKDVGWAADYYNSLSLLNKRKGGGGFVTKVTYSLIDDGWKAIVKTNRNQLFCKLRRKEADSYRLQWNESVLERVSIGSWWEDDLLIDFFLLLLISKSAGNIVAATSRSCTAEITRWQSRMMLTKSAVSSSTVNTQHNINKTQTHDTAINNTQKHCKERGDNKSICTRHYTGDSMLRRRQRRWEADPACCCLPHGSTWTGERRARFDGIVSPANRQGEPKKKKEKGEQQPPQHRVLQVKEAAAEKRKRVGENRWFVCIRSGFFSLHER